jgi:hypothetical protein
MSFSIFFGSLPIAFQLSSFLDLEKNEKNNIITKPSQLAQLACPELPSTKNISALQPQGLTNNEDARGAAALCYMMMTG